MQLPSGTLAAPLLLVALRLDAVVKFSSPSCTSTMGRPEARVPMSQDAIGLTLSQIRLKSQQMRALTPRSRPMGRRSGAAPWSTTATWIKQAMEPVPSGITKLNRAVTAPLVP